MICILPLTIYRYASAHIDGIATKYSEIVETKVIQEKMANCNESLLKISEMRGLLSSIKMASNLMPMFTSSTSATVIAAAYVVILMEDSKPIGEKSFYNFPECLGSIPAV